MSELVAATARAVRSRLGDTSRTWVLWQVLSAWGVGFMFLILLRRWVIAEESFTAIFRLSSVRLWIDILTTLLFGVGLVWHKRRVLKRVSEWDLEMLQAHSQAEFTHLASHNWRRESLGQVIETSFLLGVPLGILLLILNPARETLILGRIAVSLVPMMLVFVWATGLKAIVRWLALRSRTERLLP